MAKLAAAVAAIALLGGCVHSAQMGPEPRTAPAAFEGTHPATPTRSEVQEGYATWYGAALAGHKTATRVR
jgi:rare lipoprotein A (peptidoglycan hydrolase)